MKIKKDSNVEAVRNKLKERARVGLNKYKVTTDRKDFSTLDWITYAQEEAMDLCVYLERLKKDIKKIKI